MQHEDYDKNPSADEELSDIDEDYLRKEQEKRMSEGISFSQYKRGPKLEK